MPRLGLTIIGVYEDNNGAIAFAQKYFRSSNIEHIDVRYHFLRELVISGDISVQYLRSEHHADIITKPNGTESFERHGDFLSSRG